ncbi:helix-turn-helix domain-containing protein [Paenibacillus allorhizosphaerae]|uniref:HTH-type transcriptional regulator YesS n=1 Tax=Paenibacillus allorhizosphaerae TaxID=2849866 RepID=A0ABN7TW95_9BACL|nr:helix-turn-helix domain-containing protein [Paenibacillus allorhizosphaerae]CAG7652989.1 HTH-type transcriptional regulator YesS [Paenibacillus allorhizosphaerae]
MLLPRTISIHRRSIVLTWLFSYLAVLLLPVMISVIVYRESSTTLEGEIHQANLSLLKQVREVMDNYFLSMERLNFEMTWNLQMQELLNSNKYASSPNEYIYDRYKLTQDFNLYQSAYPTVDLFYTYLGGDNTVVLPGTVRSGPFAYQTLHADPSFPYGEWSSLVDRKDFRGFVPMVRIDENLKIRKTVAYVSPYNTDKDGTLATNVVMIDQARILGAIQNVELFNKGHVLILNRNNETLVSNANETIPSDFPFDQLGDESKFFYYKKDGEKYEIHSIRSERVGLTYISMIPSSLYWEKAQHVRNLTYVSVLISLSGGSLLTYVFLRRNYNPVRRLVQTFSGKSNVSYGKEHNEFQFLEQAIGSTLSEMDKIMDRMKSQQHILRSNFIARLLKGRIDSQIPVDESLITFNMKPISSDFAVIMLYVEASAPFHERLDGMETGDKQKLLQFIVSNVVEELAGRRHRGYTAEVDHTLACLINVSEQDEGSRMDDLMQIAKEAQAFLNTHYHLHLTLSISSIHSGIDNIAKAYLEALDAMEYKLVMGSNEILSYEQIYKTGADDSEPAAYYYPLQVEQQLINYVKIGDFERSKETLSGIIERNLNRPVVSIAIARCLMLDLVSTMMKTVSEIGDGQEHFLLQNTKRIERLSTCETLQDMQMQMTGLLQKVCDYTSAKRQQNIQQSRQHALSELAERITAFIHEHYRDPNLNITMIGHHFEMKPTYMSRLFKDHTGEGLLDFINKVRIEKAKQLIADSKKNITDASSLAGFNDVNAFIRTFKKYEGITPGKYKELLEE